ncbi:MAG: DUF1292 domain-containing protein [Eubacteriales bacterium]|nr:DUF1292 domain-containing protein [Eubacteriales bacterium]
MIEKNLFFAPHDDCACGCGCSHDENPAEQSPEEFLEVVFEDSEMIEIVDEDGEKYEFYVVDEFDFEDNDYCVMMTREDPFEFLIAKIEDDESGESFLVTLEEDEEDAVYAYYDELLENSTDDEDEEVTEDEA